MDIKRQIKYFQRATARHGLFIFYWLYSKMPYGLIRGMTRLLNEFAFRLVIRQRRTAKKSLNKAFGREKSDDEINRILKVCFFNFGRGMSEMLYYLSHPKMVSQKVVIEGKENLENALAGGNGVIAVTAHFGNFPLMMLNFALEGYKTNCVIRPTRDEKVEEFLFEKRTKVGLNTIYALPRNECVSNSLKVLRNNEILFIPIDQNFGNGSGVFVEFFGQKAATATGPVIFAKRTGAALLPMFIFRNGDDTHRIIIEAPLTLEESDDEEEMITKNMSKLTKRIEQYIRKYPHEWGWMHRRWKSRPYNTKYLPNA